METINKNKKSIWDEMTNQYSLSKTLRFELKPIGKTLENIKNIGLIEEDKQRAEDYKEVKKIMDKYYKYFIERVFQKVSIDMNLLRDYVRIYEKIKKDKNNDSLKKEFKTVQKELRIHLHNQVKGKGSFKDFFNKEFIKSVLPNYESLSYEEKEYIKKFESWNTYFTGFYENRKNIFSTEEIPTSIYYRIVHENLPKFVENSIKFQSLKEYENRGFDLGKIEKEFKSELEDMSLNIFFSLDNFNNLLNQKGIDKFNFIIGGYSKEDGTKVQGLNESINLFSQQFFKENRDEFKKIRKLKFDILFKQILSDRESNSFVIETIENDSEVIEKINEFSEKLDRFDFEEKIKAILKNLKDFDLKKIYVKNDLNLSLISQKLFKDYSKITSALEKFAQSNIDNLKGKKEERYFIWAKKTKYFSIYEIEEGLRLLRVVEDMDKNDREKYIAYVGEKNIQNPFCAYFSKSFSDDVDLFKQIKENKSEYEVLIKRGFKKDKEEDVQRVKKYLDSIINLLHFIKSFYIEFKNNEEENGSVLETDSDFYTLFNEIYLGEANKKIIGLKDIIKLYNQVRNYLTKKSFDTKKFKLNFQNSTLLAGWDINKEKSNSSIIFRKGGLYYLGIMSKGNNKIFDNVLECNDNDEYYEKVNYKLAPGPNKMLPKVFLSKKGIETFKPTKEILDLYENGEHKKGDTFNLGSCHKLIDYFKACIPKYKENPNDEYGWDVFDSQFSPTKTYSDISEFYKEFEAQSYKIWFKKVSTDYIDELVKVGKLFLFQIYNKDFSKYSKGRKNLHTIYWTELFSEENLKDVVYKLNGEAEVFFRKASVSYSKDIFERGHHYEELKSKFDYPIIKDKRYSVDKFLFHCPITINFKSGSNYYFINNKVNNIIKENFDGINILSIDRGERHLAYWTLLDSKGNIIDQGSFNKVEDDFKREKDYHEKLDKLEGERDKARKSWSKIENIKELKEGYLSQIVHQISKKAIENNALVIFEDLNFGFKRGRFKIEKQIYQKFERALIEKLNFLMFKDRENIQNGGSLKAYQLTPKFESFKKLGKQTGIIFYVDPNYTSKIDPKTGFINLIKPKYENESQAREFFKKFNYIKYYDNEDLFEFNFNSEKFGYKKNIDSIDGSWSIWSNGIKIRQYRDSQQNNNWVSKEEDVTDNLKILFNTCNIDYENGDSILSEVISVGGISLLKGLIFNLKLILQLRNSYTDTELKEKIKSGELRDESGGDYILSCVKDNDGNFFDSRKAKITEPENADANGAYNIGIKGLLVLEKLKNSKDLNKLKSKDLAITRDEFVNYIIERNS